MNGTNTTNILDAMIFITHLFVALKSNEPPQLHITEIDASLIKRGPLQAQGSRPFLALRSLGPSKECESAAGSTPPRP
jgi:hypothetical protein